MDTEGQVIPGKTTELSKTLSTHGTLEATMTVQ